MEITCGIALFNKNDEILVCHPTGSRFDFWSLPKGLCDLGENFEVCAKRELKEETGIELPDDFDLREAQMYNYPNKNKALKGFYGWFDVDISDLRCYSYVSSLKGVTPFPEVDAFTYIKISDASRCLNKPAQQLIKDIIRVEKYGISSH